MVRRAGSSEKADAKKRGAQILAERNRLGLSRTELATLAAQQARLEKAPDVKTIARIEKGTTLASPTVDAVVLAIRHAGGKIDTTGTQVASTQGMPTIRAYEESPRKVIGWIALGRGESSIATLLADEEKTPTPGDGSWDAWIRLYLDLRDRMKR